MVVISREEAVCLFYAVPYNEENIRKYTKIIDELEDVGICYSRNPKKPKLLCTRVIYANWFIKLYTSKETIENNMEASKEANEDNKENEEVDEIVRTKNKSTLAQLKQFMDIMYLPKDPKSISYERKYLSSDSIMSDVQNYSSVFRDEPFNKFVRWCSTQKLAFLDTAVKRKYKALPTKSSLRGIYVLKDCFKDG
ncbi:hypothetical protein BDF20DRAFT_858210 [Mycotypha africana]|uniref:uncharacterized protein n=1 Tax=Mycotypha africana TaxID=64632 RepID=UPI0023002ED4|nr:uncharacterized protein BDF20DRAFT_858210 [Mycotypha africana]KAI8984135.1 hypothetical protein BDF20DRAFT_858210 [Mycotypha africana]